MRGIAAISALLLSLAAGCGGEETFDAAGFVNALNDKGAGLELLDPLPNDQEGVEVYAVALEAGGGGSITVTEDETSGRAEYERCESAPILLCYRAANVVLFLEDELGPEARASLESALRRVAAD